MDERFSLIEVAIDGETQTAVTGVLTSEGSQSRARGWLDGLSLDCVSSKRDLRAATSSGHQVACPIRCTSISSSPARTEFDVVGEVEISKLG